MESLALILMSVSSSRISVLSTPSAQFVGTYKYDCLAGYEAMATSVPMSTSAPRVVMSVTNRRLVKIPRVVMSASVGSDTRNGFKCAI